jgi:hypothetical protein
VNARLRRSQKPARPPRCLPMILQMILLALKSLPENADESIVECPGLLVAGKSV